ncbi:MAG: hypothetical protein ACRC8Y_08400, partial [Chroococcales cyanobacterium]
MAQCPVCQATYVEGEVKNCSTCGWDLTPYPLTLGRIPDSFLRKERAQLSWARNHWRSQSQSKPVDPEQTTQAQMQLSQLKTQLELSNQERVQLQSLFEQTEEAYWQLHSKLETTHAELDSAKKDREQAQSQLEDAKKAQQSLKSQLETSQIKLEEFTQECSQYKSQIHEAAKAYWRLQDRLEQEEKERDRIQSELTKA